MMLPAVDLVIPIWLSPVWQGHGSSLWVIAEICSSTSNFGKTEAQAEEMQCLSLENAVLFPWQ